MPWQYPSNVPDSMKYLKPSIQKKGISIANAILENGGSESIAIATGIKKAKELHSKAKSFKKTASLNWAADAAENQERVLAQTQAAGNTTVNALALKLTRPKSFRDNFSNIGRVIA